MIVDSNPLIGPYFLVWMMKYHLERINDINATPMGVGLSWPRKQIATFWAWLDIYFHNSVSWNASGFFKDFLRLWILILHWDTDIVLESI